jgi:uncharacterized damage-inducible protein DinB
VHPLVAQLRFSRSEFLRGIDGVSADEAQRRLLPMNCISWNVGHLAWQEQRYWLLRAQGKMLVPEIQELFAYGAPASTPALDDSLRTWRTITAAADPWLDAVTTETLQSTVTIDGKPSELIFGSLLQRMLYHYWYHTGENLAIRQQLGHTGLPDFVGDIDAEAPYRSESTGA